MRLIEYERGKEREGEGEGEGKGRGKVYGEGVSGCSK